MARFTKSCVGGFLLLVGGICVFAAIMTGIAYFKMAKSPYCPDVCCPVLVTQQDPVGLQGVWCQNTIDSVFVQSIDASYKHELNAIGIATLSLLFASVFFCAAGSLVMGQRESVPPANVADIPFDSI
jgi:hypothetical protein